MTSGDHEIRIANLELRMDVVQPAAREARYLSGMHESEIGALKSETLAVKRILSAHVEQTAERFALVNQRFDRVEKEMRAGFTEMNAGFTEMNTRFAEMDAGFAEMRAGFATIGSTLDRMRDDS